MCSVSGSHRVHTNCMRMRMHEILLIFVFNIRRNKVVCDVRVSFPLVVDEEKSLKYEQFIFDFFFDPKYVSTLIIFHYDQI